VPVEKIVYQDKIVNIPVEKIVIKEVEVKVEVEKTVFLSLSPFVCECEYGCIDSRMYL
jgi:hypothetical protein